MCDTVLFSLLFMFIDSLIYYRVMNSNLTYKYNPKYRINVLILAFTLLLVRFIIGHAFNVSSSALFFMQVIIILSLFAFSYFFYQGSPIKKIVVPLIFLFLLTLSELIVIPVFVIILRESVTKISSNNFYYRQMALTSKIIVLILLEIYNKRKRAAIEFPRRFIKEIVIISGVDLGFIIFVATIWRRATSVQIGINDILSTMLCVVFAISAITIVLLYRLAGQAEKEMESKLRFQQIEMENKLNTDMAGVVESLRSLRHDMNSHMGILKGLLQFKQYEDLSEYLDSICEELQSANNFLVIENKVLSVLINSKITKAIALGIDFQPSVAIKTMNITDRDMCALIGNIIENAIEAAERVHEDKYILLKIEDKPGYCNIYCENTYSVKPIRNDDGFATTKSDRDLHGIGTKIIKSIVEKYNGSMDITIGELFTVNIDIPSDNKACSDKSRNKLQVYS